MHLERCNKSSNNSGKTRAFNENEPQFHLASYVFPPSASPNNYQQRRQTAVHHHQHPSSASGSLYTPNSKQPKSPRDHARIPKFGEWNSQQSEQYTLIFDGIKHQKKNASSIPAGSTITDATMKLHTGNPASWAPVVSAPKGSSTNVGRPRSTPATPQRIGVPTPGFASQTATAPRISRKPWKTCFGSNHLVRD
ncbi:hypothetical protein KP509_09G043300 [Ceratopteris richardii]|nr:hypothetical protein KP509_09G043300 [Ceratopteris richardii]